MSPTFLAITLNIREKLAEGGNPFKVQDLGLLLSHFIGLLLIAAAIAALFFLILGGLLSSGLPPGEIKPAPRRPDKRLLPLSSAW